MYTLLKKLLPLALVVNRITLATPYHADPGLSLEARFNAPSALVYDSKQLPEIVQNVCWSQNCLALEGKLVYDAPDNTMIRARRRAAGCEPRPNRCANVNGKNCDEYPFARTYFADGYKSRVNRCVPTSQNNAQGSMFSAFLRSNSQGCHKMNPCTFSLGYTMPNTLSHCNPKFSCKDDNQVVGPRDPSRSASENIPPSKQGSTRTFRTDTGMRFAVPSASDMRVGGIAYTVHPRNGTTFEDDDMQVNAHNVIEEMESYLSEIAN